MSSTARRISSAVTTPRSIGRVLDGSVRVARVLVPVLAVMTVLMIVHVLLAQAGSSQCS
jgi:hypothetical protein